MYATTRYMVYMSKNDRYAINIIAEIKDLMSLIFLKLIFFIKFVKKLPLKKQKYIINYWRSF